MNPPSTAARGRWSVLAVVGLGTFMSALDGSAVNAVLPVIRTSFDASIATVEWVVTIYLLVVSALLLSFGRLGDIRGHRGVYLLGLVLFGSASGLCAGAPSVEGLVAARGVQGLGAAMLFANGPALLTRTFPGQERGRVLGLLATMTYLGLTTGPSVGGWIVQAWGWRWVFLLNLPVGALVLVLGWRRLPRGGGEGRRLFDLAGAALFAAGLTGVLIALNRAPAWGWIDPRTAALAAVSAAALGAFLVVERRAASPMLDLGLFRSRPFSASVLAAGLNYISVFTTAFLTPFYLIQGRGLEPGHAGTILSAQPLVMAVTAPLSGTLSDRIGSRVPSTVGLFVLAAGLFLLSRLGPESTTADILAALAVAGFGTGIFISPNSSTLMGAAPKGRQGIAGGVMAAARNVGMVLGVGMAGAILATHLGAAGSAPGIDMAAAQRGLFGGVSAGFLAAAGVALLGALVSAARGSHADSPARGGTATHATR